MLKATLVMNLLFLVLAGFYLHACDWDKDLMKQYIVVFLMMNFMMTGALMGG